MTHRKRSFASSLARRRKQAIFNRLLAVSDSGLIVSGGADRTVRLWRECWPDCQAVLRGHTEQVHAVAVSAEGRLVLSGSADESVRLWNAASGKEIKKFLVHSHAVRSVAISPDGARRLER